MLKQFKLHLIILGTIGLIIIGVFYTSVLKISAQTPLTSKLAGYAWSNNIGWIDFSTSTNNTNGISVDKDGKLSGYAWSDYIGWIKFGGLTGFPTSGAGVHSSFVSIDGGSVSKNAQIVENKLVGWARVCGGMDDGTPTNNTCTGTIPPDGWDGWISFGGKTDDGSTYAVSFSENKNFSGYAWGSDIIGWISFSGKAEDESQYGVKLLSDVPPPFYVLSTQIFADSNSIKKDTSTIISWISTGVDFCTTTKKIGNNTATIFSTLNSGLGITSGNLAEDTFFKIDCIGGNKLVSDFITVKIDIKKKEDVSCNDWTYGEWSPTDLLCKEGQTQTRDILTSLPETCTGGLPKITQICSQIQPPPPPPLLSCVGCEEIFTEDCTFTEGNDTAINVKCLPDTNITIQKTTCTSSQFYVNKKTVWTIKPLSGTTIQQVVWSGTNIGSILKQGPITLGKIYTTVGKKNIQAVAKAISSEGAIVYFGCSASTTIKLGTGKNSEI